MKLIRYTACIGFCIATLGLVGCANHSDRTTGEYVDDLRVSNRVKDALDDAPVYKFPDVRVTVYRGTVQLSGFVQSDDQKNKAAEVASKVQGVNEIVNSILIKPLAPTGRPQVRDSVGDRVTPAAPQTNAAPIRSASPADTGGTSRTP